jgi:predicted RNA binding protein YcfA (HicA-like mRNA interferase family)
VLDHANPVKVREVLERLHDEGWRVARQRGSHRQFVHPDYPGRRVTVAGHPRLDIPKGTLNSIFKQAGWK